MQAEVNNPWLHQVPCSGLLRNILMNSNSEFEFSSFSQHAFVSTILNIHWDVRFSILNNFNRLILKFKILCYKVMLCSGGEFLSVPQWSSVRQGTQHFTDENKVSRKWSDSVHLLPFKLNKNNTTTHWVLFVKIQNQKSIKLSYNNIYYKTHSQLYIRPTINL